MIPKEEHTKTSTFEAHKRVQNSRHRSAQIFLGKFRESWPLTAPALRKENDDDSTT